MQIGLRVDVDTLRGTRLGVPELCRILRRHRIRASFFFSVGPDNMGRHLWRLLRPAFLFKMLRTRAASLYGLDILLRGTLWPGPVIGRRAAPAIRGAAEDQHEIGFHAWDHHAWQSRVGRAAAPFVRNQLERGVALLESVTGKKPICSAAPAWRCTETVLREKMSFPFEYNSDCRGDEIFRPRVNGQVLPQVQVPCTMPTLDEVVGIDGASAEDYYRGLLARFDEPGLHVLTIHAEAEGIAYKSDFEDFVASTLGRGHRLVPLGRLVQVATSIPSRAMTRSEVPGREGWVSWQGGAD